MASFANDDPPPQVSARPDYATLTDLATRFDYGPLTNLNAQPQVGLSGDPAHVYLCSLSMTSMVMS